MFFNVNTYFYISGIMSELESVLHGASSIGASSKATEDRPDNLRDKFTFQPTHERINQLPVFQCRNQLIEKTEAYPVVVVSGATGCG